MPHAGLGDSSVIGCLYALVASFFTSSTLVHYVNDLLRVVSILVIVVISVAPFPAI